MKNKILISMFIYILFIFWWFISNTYWININKSVSSNSNLSYIKHTTNWNVWQKAYNFKVLTHNTSSIYNYNTNKYIDLNMNYSNIKSINWLFLTPAEQNWKYADTFSYWMANLNIWWNTYSNYWYYIFVWSWANDKLVAKSFIDVKDKDTLKNTLWNLYNTYNPKYLAYNVLYKYNWKKYTDAMNDFKNYINNLSYSDRTNIIKDISNNWYKQITTNWEQFIVLWFQNNPLYNNNAIQNNSNLDFLSKENNTVKTIYSWDWYESYHKQWNDYVYDNVYDIYNKQDYIASDWFMKETKFDVIPDIKLNSWIYFGFAWFIRDLYDGYSWPSMYNSLSKNTLNIDFWIATTNWDNFIPTFLWNFKTSFLNEINDLIVNKNQNFQNILDYIKSLYINTANTKSMYDWVDIYNSSNYNQLIYDYNVWYTRIDNTLYKNIDTEITNFLYNYNWYIPESWNILYANDKDYTNSSITYKDYFSVSDSSSYDNSYCYWQYWDDDYIVNNKKHRNTSISFINQCSTLNKVKKDWDFTAINLDNKYPYLNWKIIYQKYIDKYWIDLKNNKWYWKYNIILWLNFPNILPKWEKSQMTSVFFVDKDKYLMNTDNSNLYISNDLNTNDNKYYISSDTYSNKTWVVISLFKNSNIKKHLVFNHSWDLITKTLQSIWNIDLTKDINKKALWLFILSSLNNKDILTNTDQNINLNISDIDSIPQIIYYKTWNDLITEIDFQAYKDWTLKDFYVKYRFNNNYNVDITKIKPLSNYKNCNNYIPYIVNYNYIIKDTISLWDCDNISFNDTDTLSYNIWYNNNIEWYLINDNQIVNKEYWITNFKRFENTNYNKLKADWYLWADNNYKDSKYDYFRYYISLIDDDYQEIFKHNVFVKKALYKKDFIAYPKNNSTSWEIFSIYNWNNTFESDYFNINSDTVNSKYINYIENDINYVYSWWDQTLLYQLDNSNTVDKIEKNKDYYIKINVLPNFEKASKIKFDITQNTRQKDIQFICWNKQLNWVYNNGELNNITFINNDDIQQCYLKLHYNFNSKEDITNFKFDTIRIKFTITDNSNKKIEKEITLRPLMETNTALLNNDCSYYFLNDNWQITDNLITNYNWFGWYIHYKNPNPSKKLKYIKLNVKLLSWDLVNSNPYFEFERDWLLNEQKFTYNPIYKKSYNNIIKQSIIRNNTEYQIVLPFQQSTIQAIHNAQLIQAIQLRTNLANAGDKSWKVKLDCQFVYTDNSAITKNWVASFKSIWWNNQDYVATNVYNAEDYNDPIYARQIKYDWNWNNVCKSSDYWSYLNRKCWFFYAILELNYYHLKSTIPLSNSRVPYNTNWDVNPNWYPLDANWITYWDTYIEHNYLWNYYPVFSWTNMYWYSIKDTMWYANTWRWGANTPNNYYTYHWSNCWTFQTEPKKPPIYDSSRTSYLWQWYWWYKTVRITWELKWHATKLSWWANNSDTVSQVWNIWIPFKNWYSENDVKYIYHSNYSKYQISWLDWKENDDASKLVPRIVLADEFNWEVSGLKLRFYPQDFNTFHYTPWQSNTITTKFEMIINLKEQDINNIKRNNLYKLIENWENKPFFIMQIPMIVWGNYAGIDNVNVSLWWNTSTEKQNDIFKKTNDKILEFMQKNQRKIMVNMKLHFKKYIKSVFEQWYLHSRANTHRVCGRHSCRCVLDNKWSNWIHQWFWEYKMWESNEKSQSSIYNNYVVKIYQPSEKVWIMSNAYIKNMPSYYFIWKNIAKKYSNWNFKEYYIDKNIDLNKTKLWWNKKMDYISYLFKTFDFAKVYKKWYEYINLKSILENNDKDWKMYIYDNAKNFYIEDKWNNKVKYRWKKIIYVDGDLYINSSIIPADKNSYVYFIVNWDIYLNSNADVINAWFNVFWNVIALDWEKVLLLIWPLNVWWKILNYRKWTHSFPDIEINWSRFWNVQLQWLMKNSLLIWNDYRYLNQPIMIKKIFSMKRF